jgi:hypothetical protein
MFANTNLTTHDQEKIKELDNLILETLAKNKLNNTSKIQIDKKKAKKVYKELNQFVIENK